MAAFCWPTMRLVPEQHPATPPIPRKANDRQTAASQSVQDIDGSVRDQEGSTGTTISLNTPPPSTEPWDAPLP